MSLDRIAAIALIGLAGILGYKTLHPTTKFAADGTDRNWDEAVESSQASGRPTIVLFTAGWCPACQSLHNTVLSRDEVHHELFGHYSVYTVDLTNPTPQVRAHAQKLNVRFIPQFIRFDKDGVETDRTNFLDAGQMLAWLKAGE